MNLMTKSFGIAVLAEFLATTLLVFFICGSTLQWPTFTPNVFHVSLAVGFTVATTAFAIGHITGGLLNPSVTIAMMVTKRLSVKEGIIFSLVQIVGGKFNC